MVTLAIQAGGQSRRMGRDKGLVRLGGRPLVAHLLERLSGLADDVIVTTNDPEAYTFLGVRLVSDPVPGAGALAGLATALEAASGDRTLVVACDMPFVRLPLASHLLALASDHDAVVPRLAGEFEPLLAVYGRACLPAIQSCLASGQHRVISFFPEVRLRPVEDDELRLLDPDGRSFFNVNTPEDLLEAERMLVRETGASASPDPLPPGD
jgi:molybdopterin-guanine dinucleotide biosynthesis protein A